MNTSLISSLSIGDLVVHEHFGIGRFNGLTRLVTASIEGEYVWLQYQENASVYVPLNKLGLLSLYSNQDAPVSLNNLNDRKWAKRTQAAKKATQELVDDIFLVQKIRHLKRGTAFSPDTDLQLDFELQFPHPLTPDQRSAIAEIKSQMESIRPMDHLLCGDVGFGKTEVFLRAAFKAIQDRKQVAILVPTTILADQHYQHIVDRFSGFDCRIAQLSRFSSNDEKRTLISALKSHQIDLVIGTHRLIQKDIQFADLGLIIIDEEQRFGVYHKEKLKSFKHCVDVLSVTATPIPRTLYLALTGTKTISKIESPPLGRQLIKLKLHPFSEQAVLAAIDDELNRKGQVYYVINHIDRLYQTRKFLLKHRPLARIEIIHSQVPKCRLKRIMQQVYRQEIDILLSTTIIENGIDIPTVNTIIIIDAQNFGLSQIHQLKGRVGRRDTQGIAYLFTSGKIRPDTQKRLDALRHYIGLGSGYSLALSDLQIRGAGHLLGTQQHGHIRSIGFHLYCRLLNDATMQLNGKQVQPRILSHIDPNRLMISETYIPHYQQRLAIYEQLTQISNLEALTQLKTSIQDRYGKLPTQVDKVFKYIKSKL